MFVYFLALFVSAADAPAVLGGSFVLRARIALSGDRPVALVARVASRREHQAAGRPHAPVASAAVRLTPSSRTRAGVVPALPLFGPLACAARSSSQRDPPLALV